MKNGGPAFSAVFEYFENDPETVKPITGGGMSLRDYFAAAALTGIMANDTAIQVLRDH